MSCLWVCLSLLCAATFLPSSGSSSDGVSLKCNKTMEAVAGETVTINCTILFNLGTDCIGQYYFWSNTQGGIPRNSDLMKYSCEWDNLTYVSLTISNVVEEANYTVSIETDCGTAESSAIRVQVKQRPTITPGEPTSGHGCDTPILPGKLIHSEPDQPTEPHRTPVVLGVFTTLVVFGLFFFLFGTDRGREIIKRRRKTQEDPSDMDTVPGSQDSLIA